MTDQRSINVNGVPAVESRNLMLSYRNRGQTNTILDRFHLKIPSGSVYSLIGPSGCGKTTYLRSIIGLKKLDSGETRIFGFPLGHRSLDIPGRDLGYMPQETALNDDLTISEMINYFGNLYGVQRKELKSRSLLLCKRLGLPDINRPVARLSGGQQRRVSFICTLIHSPRLMILDEPTVGCDPLIIETMWECVFEIARSAGTTVIVTTHYLEEARKTDMIGFMRKGHLLAQGEPSKILDRYQVDSIEKAFAKMVKQDKVRKSLAVPTGSLPTFARRPSSIAPRPLFTRTNVISQISRYIQVSQAVFHRVALRYTKIKLHLFGSTILTLLLVGLAAICLGPTPHGLKVGYINNEQPVNYSYSFVNSINTHVINLIAYNNSESAHYDMEEARIHGYFTVSAGYTDEMISLMTFQKPPSEVHPDRDSKGIVTFHQSHEDLISDTIEHFLNKALNISAWRLSRRVLHHPKRAQAPLIVVNSIAEPELDEDIFNSRNFFIQVNTMFWSFAVNLYFSIFTFHRDYSDSLYERSHSAGSTPTQFLLSHLIVSIFIPAFNCLPVLILIIVTFGATAKGSILLTALIYWINNVAAIVTAFIMATMKLDVFFILVFAGAYCFVTMFLGAAQWSTISLPYFLKPVTWIFPNIINNPAMIRVMVHGDGLDSSQVYLQFCTLLAI
ncbi:ABC transporter G family member 23-like [Panonychus citri]|uniref:ABC transporter G family member 23-like n=1 Tax=Panonychus citri TaxID=50023 RepID=UPI002306E5E9|nr:ABC transporter G family member 23-like [Panonychus citri]